MPELQQQDGCEILFRQGLEHYERGCFELAAVCFEKAGYTSPAPAKAWLNSGESWSKAGKQRNAVRSYRRLLSEPDSYFSASLGLGVALKRAKKYSYAIHYINQAIQINPDVWRCWAVLAEVLFASGKKELSIVAAEKAVSTSAGSSAEPHFVLGTILAKHGKLTESIEEFDAAVRIDPNHVTALHNLAIGHFHTQNIGKALEFQLRALNGLKIQPITDTPRRSNFNTEIGKHALQRLSDVLTKADIPFFLVAGTLLGCIRDKAFLSNEKDIDLGIFDDVDADRLKQVFEDAPDFDILSDFVPSQSYFTVYFRGLAIDFFRYKQENQKLVARFNDHEGGISWSFTPFDIGKHSFFNMELPVPNDYDTYLREAYGNWRTPDKYFDPMHSSPARNLHQGSDEARYLTLGKVFWAITEGQYKYATSLLSQIPTCNSTNLLIKKLSAAT